MYPIARKDPRGGHNRSQINQNFFKSWSPQMAYVLGFIFADGAIEDVQKSSRTCYLSITTTSKDSYILEKIRNAMNSQQKLYKRNSRPVLFPKGKIYIPSDTYILRIGNKLIYNDLLTLGVTPRKSLTILFPKIPSKYLHFFVRGYFDGDGCLHMVRGKYPRVIFISGSEKFLKGLAKLLTNSLQIPIKVATSQIEKSGNRCYRLAYSTQSSKIILQFMYKKLDKAPYLERKFAIYQKYLNTIPI